MTRSPDSVPGLVRWAVVDDAATADGDTFSGQADRLSGTYGRLDTSSTGPTMRRGALGGPDAWDFGGSRGQALRASAGVTFPTAGYSVWAVARRAASGGGTTPIVLGSDDSNTAGNRTFHLAWANTTQPRFVSFDQNTTVRADVGPAVVRTEPHVLVGTASGGTSEIHVDGVSDGSTALGTSSIGGSRRLTLGAVILANSAYHYSGLTAEWGVYDHPLTVEERAVLHSYVQDRYGITVADYVPDTTPPLGENSPISTSPVLATLTSPSGLTVVTSGAVSTATLTPAGLGRAVLTRDGRSLATLT